MCIFNFYFKSIMLHLRWWGKMTVKHYFFKNIFTLKHIIIICDVYGLKI